MPGIFKLQMLKAATGQRLQIPIYDSTAAYDRPLSGLTNASAGLKAAYFRDGDTAATAIALVAGTVGTWAAGAFKEIDPTNTLGAQGFYEFSVPDAVWASGNRVTIVLSGAANMVPVFLEAQMVGNDPGSAQWSSAFGDGIASRTLAASIEAGVTLKQILEAIGAATAGNYDSATATFRAVSNNATTRLTYSSSGNNRTITPSL